jgi:NTE family protein
MPKKIGLALGGGAARGWSHVGVLRALEERGVRPDVVCGTSAGALVGAAWALGQLDDFERWLGSLERRDVFGYFDPSLTGGVLKGERIFDLFSLHVEDRPIESLPVPFGAVATDLEDGTEVWLRRGSLREAVRASISVPALFKPVRIAGRWCIDGGLSNPVPVSLCRALGAEVVIAVDVNGGRLGERRAFRQEGEPTLLEVAERTLSIIQAGLTRPLLAADPPDLLIAPAAGTIGFLEFHRAKEAFAAGRRSVEALGDELARCLQAAG